MCGRISLARRDADLLARELGLEVPLDAFAGWEPRYNIAPTQEHVVLRARGEAVEPMRARWGFVRSGGEGQVLTVINARAETLSERPSFREALARRRCVVPADGFYEWRRDGTRQPYWFHRPDGRLLLLAGLYEEAPTGAGAREPRFVVVTTAANGTVGRVHSRMPVVLDEEGADAWLFAGGDERRAAELLAPAPEVWLAARPVGNGVNQVWNEGPALIEPAAEQLSLF